MSMKHKFHIPTNAEDAMLTAGAASDFDSPPLTVAELARMQPAQAVLPTLIGKPNPVALLKRYSHPQEK